MKHAYIVKISILMILLLICSSGIILTVGAEEDRAASEAGVIEDAPANPIPPGFDTPAKPKLTVQAVKEKIAAGLSKQLQQTKSGDKIKVLIWLNMPNLPQPVRPAPGDNAVTAEAAVVSNTATVQALVATAQKSLTDSLAEKKIAVDYASPYSPLVVASLTADEIKELGTRADVNSIDIDHKFQPTLEYASPAILAPFPQMIIQGAQKMAIVECDGVAFANPYLKSNRQVALYQDAASPNIGAHATACAGIAHSTYPTARGIAYKGEAAVLSANCPHPHDWSESALISAMDWAVNNGARVLSCSFGPVDPDDGPLWTLSKHSDYLVRAYAVTIVAASGNEGDHAYPRNTVGDPAKAYNVIAVGGFKNQATGWMWPDDVMSTYSSWGDPSQPSGARTKPEVVASGETTTSNFKSTMTAAPWYGWYGGSGTSFACPAVAGEAAILMNKTPTSNAFFLSSWPEAVKAVIMASADHNIEGDSKKSEYDGVGAVNVNEAYKIAYKAAPSLPDKVLYDTIAWNGGADYRLKKNGVEGVWNLTLTQGTHARFVLVWDSRPAADSSTDSLNADLDLYVERKVGPNWVIEPLAGYSVSANNNFEIVDFYAPASGQYRVVIDKFSWLDHTYSEYIGFAAYTK